MKKQMQAKAKSRATSSKRKSSVSSRRLTSQAGLARYMVVIIVAALVVLIALGVGGYIWWSSNNSSKTTTTSEKSPSSQSSSQVSLEGTSITLLSGGLNIIVPTGWTKGYETNIVKTIDGVDYRINFQPQGVDYLALDTVGGFASEISTVKTTQGTTLHILKLGLNADATNVVVSSCAPKGGFGCSPDLDNRKLYVVLMPYGSGDQAVQPIDYSSPSASKAISEFEKIAQSLPL